MASAAGRRNILRELNERAETSHASSILNVSFPLTPTSPEEAVIKQRGRRKIVQYNLDASPVKVPGRNSPRKTPIKKFGTPTKLPPTPTRSSPRKRLNMVLDNADFDDMAIDDVPVTNRRVKHQKLHTLVDADAPLEKSIMALTHTQLVELVSSAARSSSEIRQVLEKLVPVPDLLPLEKRLYFFQRNIFKAYPHNMWGLQGDLYCYNRVKLHIETFKKECMDQCRTLVESEHWPTVLEYCLTALSYAKGLPQWPTAAHNRSKEFCIRHLVSQLLIALKNASLSVDALKAVVERMNELKMPNDLMSCYDFISRQLLDTE